MCRVIYESPMPVVIQRVEQDWPMKRLHSLDPRHKAACRMRIEGRDNAAIASELNVTKRTLTVWFSDDLVREYLEHLAENVEQEFAVMLASAGMKSVSKLAEMLDMPDRDADLAAHMKLEIARELMDRVPGTSRVRERAQGDEGDGNQKLIQIFTNMPNNDLAGFLNGGWRSLTDGDSNGQGQPQLEK